MSDPNKHYDWEHIVLAPLEESDIDLLFVWQNSARLRDLTMGFRFPIQKEAIRDWMRDLRAQNGRSKVVYAIRRNGVFCGLAQLNDVDPYQRKATFGIYIGDSAQRNVGIGYVATALMLDYAFNALDLRKVSLEVVAVNHNAVRLYDNLGFVREGVRRSEYFIGGQYQDTLMYGLLKEEFGVAIPTSAQRLCYSPQ